jgi:hypothetical protein
VLTRRDAIPVGSEWEPVWAVMKALAGLHGCGNVRLVVWFDRWLLHRPNGEEWSTGRSI